MGKWPEGNLGAVVVKKLTGTASFIILRGRFVGL